MGQIQQAVNTTAELCKKWEGFSDRPYICPAGYPTIGYGTVYKPDGTKVTMQDSPIDKGTAEAWLEVTIVSNLKQVLKASPHLINYPNTLAAITDFVYNLGIGRYNASTLKRRINQQDWRGSVIELRKWVYGSGKKLLGLIKRREDEVLLVCSEHQT